MTRNDEPQALRALTNDAPLWVSVPLWFNPLPLPDAQHREGEQEEERVFSGIDDRYNSSTLIPTQMGLSFARDRLSCLVRGRR